MSAGGPFEPEARSAQGRGLPAALLGLGLLILALNITPITNNDLFLHLKTGELVLRTGHVPEVDDYSALARGRPFTAHEWLSGVVFHVVERLGGRRAFDALILFKAAIALIVGLVLYRAAIASGATPVAALPCLALVMILAAARFHERPHIFSYLLVALFLLVLARQRRATAVGQKGRMEAFYLLPPLQVLWANLHGGFILGPAIVVLAAAGALIDGLLARRARLPEAGALLRAAGHLGGLALLLGAACLVNPYGWGLLRFPFALTGSGFMDLIYEWLPPFGSSFRATYMMRYYVLWAGIGLLALGGAVVNARRDRRAWPAAFPYLVFAAFFALSLRMNRNVTDFALATLPGVSAAAAALLTSHGRAWARRGQALPAIAGVLVALAAYFASAGYPYSPSTRRSFGLGLGPKVPVRAADYLARNGIRGTCFNTYGDGAYLVYRFHPDVRVGMDSRNDVYGEDLYEAYLEALADPESLRRMLRRLRASFIFFEWAHQGMADAARTIRDAADGWRIVFFDDATVVYLQEAGPYAGIAGRDRYLWLDPSLFRPGAWHDQDAASALVEADRAVSISGGAYIARVMRVEALMALGRAREAGHEEARIVGEDPPLAHIFILLGMAHLERGDPARAEERFRRAVDLNPYSDAARELLRQATARR